MGTGGTTLTTPHGVVQAKAAPARRPRSAPPRAAEQDVLTLQGTAGNGAVTALLQRQPEATTLGRASARPLDLTVQTRKGGASSRRRKSPKAKPASLENHAAFLNALGWLGASWPKVKGLNMFAAKFLNFDLDAEDTANLLPRHRALLMDVADALRDRERNEWAAFEAWQALGPRLRAEAFHANQAFAKYPKFDASVARNALTELDTNGFPAKRAYSALKSKTKQEHRPRTPDAASLDQLPAATNAFFETKKLYEDTAKLASSVLGDVGELREKAGKGAGLPKGAATLIEILSSTATLDDKLAEARKKLDVFSAADLLNKVVGLSQATMAVTSDIGASYAAKSLAIAEGKKVAKDIARYKHVLGKFENLGTMAKQAGTVATVISVAANYGKFVKAIWERKWDDALASGAELGLDIAGATIGGGAAGAAVMAGSVIVVKAQLEAVHLAAEFIRWCKDETVRQAAGKFVDQATKVARGSAWDLVADAEIVLDPDKAAVHDVASQQMAIHSKYVVAGLRHLDSHATATVKTAIGGHRPVVAALGRDARHAMAFPADDGLSLVMQLETVFKGIDNMARFVKANYRN